MEAHYKEWGIFSLQARFVLSKLIAEITKSNFSACYFNPIKHVCRLFFTCGEYVKARYDPLTYIQ